MSFEEDYMITKVFNNQTPFEHKIHQHIWRVFKLGMQRQLHNQKLTIHKNRWGNGMGCLKGNR